MPSRRQLVVFRVGDEEFALDIKLAREVLVLQEITPVPETRHYVEGVLNLRGNLVPVLDFRKRLRAGKADAHQGRRLIIATVDGRAIALVVDGASEVIRVGEEMIEQVPYEIHEIGADYIAGIVNLGNRFVTLIDLGKALTEEITCELDDVIKRLPMVERKLLVPTREARG